MASASNQDLAAQLPDHLDDCFQGYMQVEEGAALDADVKQIQTLRKLVKTDVIKRVTNILMSLHGDVYGDVVYNMYSTIKHDIHKVCARMNPHMIASCIDVLRTFYDVQTLLHGRKWMIMPLREPGYMGDGSITNPVDFVPFELHLNGMFRDRWKISPVPFDVDQLAMDTSHVYIRPCFRVEAIYPRSNRMEYLVNRVQNRRFTLCDPRAYQLNEQQMYFHTIKCYRKSYKAVSRGWIMDDAYLGDRTFVVSRWGLLRTWYDIIRGAASPHRKTTALHNCECPLCHEPYKQDDIVINLGCNHTFHCMCHPDKTESGGLFAWLMDQGKDTCPLCREGLLLKK